MRRPSFFPRRAPLSPPAAPLLVDPVPVGRRVAEALPPLEAEAEAAGLKMLAYLIGCARMEAERIARNDE